MTNIEFLLNIMNELRDPENGCPWDREQSFSSIAPYTIEEAYEVAEAIAQGDMGELREELGDLLFQVVFHSKMAAELGVFDFNDVVTSIIEKMLRRHPHVFGDEQIHNAETQTIAWEQHKERERKKKLGDNSNTASALHGVPTALPALTRAVKLQKRAARVGFDWMSIPPIIDKIIEELNEVKHEIDRDAEHHLIEEEIGDLFFAVSNLARHLNVDPESAMRTSNNKFERRFRSIESLARQQGKSLQDMTLDEMESLYQQIKRQE